MSERRPDDPVCGYTLNSVISTPTTSHTLISTNPRERMFVAQVSLLIVTFLSLISRNRSLMQTTQKSTHTSHCVMCRHVKCHLLIILLLLFHMPLVEYWCMHPPRRLGKSSGVDRTSVGDKRTSSHCPHISCYVIP